MFNRISQPVYNARMKFQTADRFTISSEALSQEVNGETVLLGAFSGRVRPCALRVGLGV